MRSRRPLLLAVAAVLAVSALPSASAGTAAAALPALAVEEVAAGLTNPWDSALLPDGQLLVTQRGGKLTLIGEGRMTDLRADLGDVFAEGESGLMGLALAPDFPTSRSFVTCHTHQEGGRPVDNRVVSWRLSEDNSAAERVRDPLLAALPVNPTGRHSGCRPTFGADGALLVATGDSAVGTVPQDRNAMGGKVLRVDPGTGAAAPGNPFADAPDEHEQRLLTTGQRNVQGLAVQPGTGRVWAIEQGPDVDDEVTPLTPGGNGGWDPVGGAGDSGEYNEAVPMTDSEKFGDAMVPAWRSGDPTLATSGGAFLGDRWGADAGVLAVAALKGKTLVMLRTDGDRVTEAAPAPELDQRFGRLRSVRSEGDGALYVTTDNGGGRDVVLRVTPAQPIPAQ